MLSKVPREQLGDAVDGVFGDLGQHRSEIQLWIKSVELGRADEAESAAARSQPESDPANR